MMRERLGKLDIRVEIVWSNYEIVQRLVKLRCELADIVGMRRMVETPLQKMRAIMRATVTRISDVVLVCLSGRIEIEKSKELKRVLMKDYKETKMIFCLKELSFVGSYGLTLFMQVLQDLNKENLCTIKISGATRDIQFLMDSCETIFPKFQTIDQALKAFMVEANPNFPG